MAKKLDTGKMKEQWRKKLMTLVGCVTRTQAVADQAIGMANKFMRYDEMDDSDAVRTVENLSCVCEEAMQVICKELAKGTRFQETPCKAAENMVKEL